MCRRCPAADRPSDPSRRRVFGLFALAAAGGLLFGCGGKGGRIVVPSEIDGGTACALDGMLLDGYPGPKGQIWYADDPQPLFFCDNIELFSALLVPEQVRRIDGAWVQDMGLADWDAPVGHWINARSGWYVVGSRRHGAMGPTFASFLQQADAQRFAAAYGGRVLPFAEITAEMVDLRGGALHDTQM